MLYQICLTQDSPTPLVAYSNESQPATAMASSPHTTNCLSLPKEWGWGFHMASIVSAQQVPCLKPNQIHCVSDFPKNCPKRPRNTTWKSKKFKIMGQILAHKKQEISCSRKHQLSSLPLKPNSLFWGIVDLYCLSEDVPWHEQIAISLCKAVASLIIHHLIFVYYPPSLLYFSSSLTLATLVSTPNKAMTCKNK